LVAAASLNQTPLDWQGNRRRICEALQIAKEKEAQIIVFPELAISGYGCEDSFLAPFVHDAALASLQAILPETQEIVAIIGLPIFHAGAVFNSAAVVANGQVLGIVPKKHLAGDGIHYEPRWFKSWGRNCTGQYSLAGKDIPIGDLIFKLGSITLGVEICEEAWIADRPGIALADRAVDIIVNPSASHFAFGKAETRRRLVAESSRSLCVAYIYSNLTGNESGRIIYDGGSLIADQGNVLAEGRRFSYREVEIVTAAVNIHQNRLRRSRIASFQPVMNDAIPTVIGEFPWRDAPCPLKNKVAQEWEHAPQSKMEEFTRAVSIGLFDFLRKSQQWGFVVSLSGGIDSAAVLALARTSLDFASSDLGIDGLKSRLSYIPSLAAETTVDGIAKLLLTAAYQGSANSSQGTLMAAEAVAKDLGADFLIWQIESIVSQYRTIAESALGRPLSWNADDIALQNIQARVRSPGIWLLANLKRALLLATSNRSEAAVGYATMDGDTSGGLSPICGIDKNFLRAWALWMADAGPYGLRAFPGFAAVLGHAPTAELRPQEFHQTDEGDLMPYDILDAIEALAIRDHLPPTEVWNAMCQKRPDIPQQDLRNWITKFFRLWAQNQWKRERFAPSFHLDDRNLDPRSWCRFPIISAGFAEELAMLENCTQPSV
jgi:NAD+ synthase (glutamine-hydrolysing)